MRLRYIALMATLAASLLSAPTASACNMNPTAVISAPAPASSHIHGTAVGFNGSTSTANCGTIAAYLWKNGDTTLSTESGFTYTVTLAPEQVDSVIIVSLKVTSTYNARTHTVYRTITIKRDHQSQYFVKDHLGSPRVVVDGKGAVLSHTDYYPFGMVMPGRASNISLSNDRTKFTGYLLEEEGEQDTYHAEARGYDPVIGRFTSRDPLSAQFPSWSPYTYAMNNPTLFIDPDGRAAVNTNGAPPYRMWSNLNNQEQNIILYDLDFYKANPVRNNAERATNMTKETFGFNGKGDKSDAFRHAFWMATNTQDVGESFAQKWGDAHEYSTPKNEVGTDLVMDIHNNDVGIEIGRNNPNANSKELKNIILDRMKKGDLLIINDKNQVIKSDGSPVKDDEIRRKETSAKIANEIISN